MRFGVPDSQDGVYGVDGYASSSSSSGGDLDSPTTSRILKSSTTSLALRSRRTKQKWFAELLDGWEVRDAKGKQAAWNAAKLRAHTIAVTLSDLAEATEAEHRTRRQKAEEKEMEEVTQLLEKLEMGRKEDERRTKETFEERNRLLWEGIEAAIRQVEAEREAAERAGAQALAAARKREEEAAARAAAMRAEENRRMEEERKRKEKEENEAKRMEAEASKKKEEKESKAADANRKLLQQEEVVSEAWKEWDEWRKQMRSIKTGALPSVANNAIWKRQCFTAKRQITPKVGQLTNSRQEIIRITRFFDEVLSQARQANEAIYIWVCNHLSKALIKQAETEVTAKQSTAYPLARVVVWLLLEGYQEFGAVLMSRLVKKCPWVVPLLPPREEKQDEAEYRKSLGHSVESETAVQYTDRMCGILAFYTAILQTLPTSPPSSPHNPPDLARVPWYFRSSRIWVWFARALTPPLTEHALTPALIATTIEVAGERLLELYGRQASKVFRVILDEGIRKGQADWMHEEQAKASSTRLKLMLEVWEKEGRIIGEEGRNMEP